MKIQKLWSFLNKLLFSSFFLWLLIVFFGGPSSKLGIRSYFLFLLFLSLGIFLFFKQILVFLIFIFHELNLFLERKIQEIKIPPVEPPSLDLYKLKLFLERKIHQLRTTSVKAPSLELDKLNLFLERKIQEIEIPSIEAPRLGLDKLDLFLRREIQKIKTASVKAIYLVTILINELSRIKEKTPKILEIIIASRFFWFSLVMLGAFVHIFILEAISDLLTLPLIALLLLIVWLYKFEGRALVMIGLIFLSLAAFLSTPKPSLAVEKAAIWTYIFLAVGLIKLFLEYQRTVNSDE